MPKPKSQNYTYALKAGSPYLVFVFNLYHTDSELSAAKFALEQHKMWN